MAKLAASLLPAALFLLALVAVPGTVGADENPLKPLDRSSPRATLTGFLDFMNRAFPEGYGVLLDYLKSTDLYLSPGQLARYPVYQNRLATAERVLDLSELPPAMAEESARRLTIQLKEILDRMSLPPAHEIPDAKAMAEAESTRWTLPESELRIAKVTTGPRTGEWLFDPETVRRLPEFYARIKTLPYQPGATPGWYEAYSTLPIVLAYKLRNIIPPRWLLDLPALAYDTVLDQPLWRWAGMAVVIGLGTALVWACFRLARGRPREDWRRMLRPLSLVAVAPVLDRILSDILRVSSPVYEWLGMTFNTLYYLALAWTTWVIGGVLAERVISSERLRVGSIDSQLIRLVVRLLTVMVAVFILITGADQMGLPAYSVMAGLGVGGLAFALAAQQTLANLIGSIIIMLEKPFSIGHTISVKGTEGKVENVGFRSTRIRTSRHSVVSIPSADLVNSTIENLDRRPVRRVRITLRLPYDVPGAKRDAFIEGLRRVLEANPHTEKENLRAELSNLAPGFAEIAVTLDLRVPSGGSESALRHEIFRDFLELAEATGVPLA